MSISKVPINIIGGDDTVLPQDIHGKVYIVVTEQWYGGADSELDYGKLIKVFYNKEDAEKYSSNISQRYNLDTMITESILE